jgi:hypothetical protein
MTRRLLLSLPIVVVAALIGAAVSGLLGAFAQSGDSNVPHVKHVFIIVLENENADQTFGPTTQIPYLADTLKSEGAFIPNYYGVAHNSLPNYIAMVSGQSPNPQTQADCQGYDDFQPGTANTKPSPFAGQYTGDGCVYPPGVGNVATQLEGAGYSWKGYMQDMASSAPAQPSTCRHPAINTQDGTQTAKPTDQYAARHNPFVYFHLIIDFPTCQQNDVDLHQLPQDLSSESTTPDYSFITPDLCNDGHDTPCADGGPGGMVQANQFLQDIVPQILASPAYKDNGLLFITFDEAEGGAGPGDASSCCGEPTGPNTSNNGALTPGDGGGRVGAVALSPCIDPGTVTQDAYNHYSLLLWVEKNFDLLPHLGYAGQAGLQSFDQNVLDNSTCAPPVVSQHHLPGAGVQGGVPGTPSNATKCKKKRRKHHAHSAKKSKKCKKKRHKRAPH